MLKSVQVVMEVFKRFPTSTGLKESLFSMMTGNVGMEIQLSTVHLNS